MKKNRLFAAAMAACLTAVSLAGCGSSSSSETTAAATTAAATESKAEGGDTAAAGDAVGPWKSGDNVTSTFRQKQAAVLTCTPVI